MQHLARSRWPTIRGVDQRGEKPAPRARLSRARLAFWFSAFLLSVACTPARCQQARDPLLDLMIQKGMLTQEEALKVKAEADALRTNTAAQMTPPADSKWKLGKSLKNIELFGDVRVRYEYRDAATPLGDQIDLSRGRFAARVGLRGDVFDDFYFGLRLETSSNPRSPWVTFGSSTVAYPTSTSTSPAPFGKSSDGVAFGQAYFGWHPGDWIDLTAGKMPNPLYTTPMVWDPDLNPEGLAERFKYPVGQVEFFGNFGQFVYQDNNPSYISGSLAPYVASSNRAQTSTDNTFLFAYQGGVSYQFSKTVSAKVGPTLYQYLGLTPTVNGYGIGDKFVGEGSYGGPNSGTINGLTTQNGIYYNQIGVNNLLVLDFPFELNFKIKQLNSRVFGDFAYNLQGGQRASEAYNTLATQSQIMSPGSQPPLLAYGPQRNAVKAYQIGFAISNGERLGLVYGSVSKKHTWEFRTYWQHVDQYALDPNLLDSDFFEGRGNVAGIYSAFAYSITDNFIATARYGYASRSNEKLGTGGSNLDIPQINPIQHYNLLQLDLTLRF
jgi:hypothetical protein